MSYRKITVDNTTYEYVVGRTHLKINGLQAVELAKVARKDHNDRYVIGPGMVAAYIRSGCDIERYNASLAENKIVQPDTLMSSSIAKLRKLATNENATDSPVSTMAEANNVLFDVLKTLGYEELVDEYSKLERYIEFNRPWSDDRWD